MELTPPLKSPCSLVVDSAPLLLLSIYYPCQARRPRLNPLLDDAGQGGESNRGSGFEVVVFPPLDFSFKLK